MAYADKERQREASRRSYLRNRERRRAQMKQWAEANPQKLREYYRRYRKAHLEKCRRAARRWYTSNAEKCRRDSLLWYRSNRERSLPVKRLHNRKIGGRFSSWWKHFRSGLYCCRCGSAERVEMHHRDPATKTANVSVLIGKHSWARIAAEIRKCEPLCKSCHVAHHQKARHGATP